MMSNSHYHWLPSFHRPARFASKHPGAVRVSNGHTTTLHERHVVQATSLDPGPRNASLNPTQRLEVRRAAPPALPAGRSASCCSSMRKLWQRLYGTRRGHDRALLFIRTKADAHRLAGLLGCMSYHSEAGTVEDKARIIKAWVSGRSKLENLISKAKAAHQSRSLSEAASSADTDVVFLPQDFDTDFDRVVRSNSLVDRLFSDVVGGEEWMEQFRQYQRITINMKARGLDSREQMPFNYIFKGPPGTGKTTVARKIATFYYELGILSTKEHFECSASDLVAQYVGQSGPQTRALLRKALGKVFIIDEAYRLCDGPFGKEAIDELVDSVTKPEFKGKLVVVLAGYTEEINRLLKINSGLASRFPEELVFSKMTPQACLKLLERELGKVGVRLGPECDNTGSAIYRKMTETLDRLADLPSWGNGRDVVSLSKTISTDVFGHVENATTELVAAAQEVLRGLDTMLLRQTARSKLRSATEVSPYKGQERLPDQAPKSHVTTTEPQTIIIVEAEQEKDGVLYQPTPEQPRDAGVSDETWSQLQQDRAAEKRAVQVHREQLCHQQRAFADAEEEINKSKADLTKLGQSIATMKGDVVGELQRKHEDKRIRQLTTKRKKLELKEEMEQIKAVEEARRKREALVQQKLKAIGVCPVGYQWIKQATRYRCAGGSHFVANALLKI